MSGIKDHVQKRLTNEELFFHITDYLDTRLKNSSGPATKADIASHICQHFNIRLGELDTQAKKDIERDIQYYIDKILNCPELCSYLMDNEICLEQINGKNHYKLRTRIKVPTQGDFFNILKDYQYAATFLEHINGIIPFMDGNSESATKIERFTGESISDSPFGVDGKEPFLVVKKHGDSTNVLHHTFSEIYDVTKNAIRQNKMVSFDYQSRDATEAKSYPGVDAVGFMVILGTGSIKLVYGKKTNDSGKMTYKAGLFNLEKIQNISVSDMASKLTSDDRKMVYLNAEENVGNYMIEKTGWVTATIVASRGFSDYIMNIQWLSFSKILHTAPDEIIYEVHAPIETVLSAVHGSRGEASIIHPPELISAFKQECEKAKAILDERKAKHENLLKNPLVK